MDGEQPEVKHKGVNTTWQKKKDVWIRKSGNSFKIFRRIN